MCCPNLTYGTDCVDISSKILNQMESLQGTLVKRCIGVPKRNHHTTILNALEIRPLQTAIRQQTTSLFSRIFKVDSQMKDICITLLAQYKLQKKLCPGTIVERLVRMGISPLETTFARPLKSSQYTSHDDVVDTLKNLMMHEHFYKAMVRTTHLNCNVY